MLSSPLHFPPPTLVCSHTIPTSYYATPVPWHIIPPTCYATCMFKHTPYLHHTMLPWYFHTLYLHHVMPPVFIHLTCIIPSCRSVFTHLTCIIPCCPSVFRSMLAFICSLWSTQCLSLNNTSFTNGSQVTLVFQMNWYWQSSVSVLNSGCPWKTAYNQSDCASQLSHFTVLPKTYASAV